ncbi:MAG: hypothetical protein RMK57_09645 [Bryobacterales bacterium]|nr:hypothetical protein [Bryobacteraceae bacterium]MDW8354781.1 hypothetical protein [Bryobacterales bacterium]
MTQVEEAIARYHKLIQTPPYQDLTWAQELQQRMLEAHLAAGGRPITPFLRPHFLTRRGYQALVRAAEALFSAIDRIKQMVLADPALLARIELLPAEKMLAAVDPGYSFLSVTSLLDTHFENGSLHFVNYNSDTAPGVAYGEVLADLFYEAAPVKEFRRRYKLTKLGGARHLVRAVLEAYKQFGGKRKPHIGVLEFRQPFQAAESGEYLLLCELFRRAGCTAQVVAPDALEYKGGVLRQGDFTIDVVFRRVKVQEFLLRFDLSHPLVRAYRDRAVCVVNSFRSELAHKRALFALLTDEGITGKFPASERRAIEQYIPWTRVVAQTRTTYKGEQIDLPEFILKNRERLVLKPNDDAGDYHAVRGWETDQTGWERALRMATRYTYVVQERVEPVRAVFPLYRYGELEMRELQVDVHPHAYLGKVEGCSSWVSDPTARGFSSIAGLTPTFILEGK